jgi:hypothetical protein
VIHGGSEQRKAGSERRPHEIVPGKDASGVFWVGIGQIVEDAVEEEEGADGEPGCADDGNDPVNGLACGPDYSISSGFC